eukprot:scaffold1239_cov175-Pinguiococcus_pyrenoidosus.AAC.35
MALSCTSGSVSRGDVLHLLGPRRLRGATVGSTGAGAGAGAGAGGTGFCFGTAFRRRQSAIFAAFQVELQGGHGWLGVSRSRLAKPCADESSGPALDLEAHALSADEERAQVALDGLAVHLDQRGCLAVHGHDDEGTAVLVVDGFGLVGVVLRGVLERQSPEERAAHTAHEADLGQRALHDGLQDGLDVQHTREALAQPGLTREALRDQDAQLVDGAD